jgi:hypothetical protein
LVLAVGIDWAEQFHLVALGRPGEGVTEVLRVEHTPTAVTAPLGRIATLEPDPPRSGWCWKPATALWWSSCWTQASRSCRSTPTWSPAAAARPARRTTPRTPASAACWHWTATRPCGRSSPTAAELRSIARDDQRAARDQRRLLNRLRQNLLATFPAAVEVAGDDLAAPAILKLLARWPTHHELTQASREELVAFARSCRHGWPERFTDRVQTALATDHFPAKDYLVRAKADTIRLAATQLLAITTQRRAWERRMAQLLLGARPPASPAAGAKNAPRTRSLAARST